MVCSFAPGGTNFRVEIEWTWGRKPTLPIRVGRPGQNGSKICKIEQGKKKSAIFISGYYSATGTTRETQSTKLILKLFMNMLFLAEGRLALRSKTLCQAPRGSDPSSGYKWTLHSPWVGKRSRSYCSAELDIKKSTFHNIAASRALFFLFCCCCSCFLIFVFSTLTSNLNLYHC